MDLGDDDSYYNVNHKTREDTLRTHEEGDALFKQGLYHRSVEYYKIVSIINSMNIYCMYVCV